MKIHFQKCWSALNQYLVKRKKTSDSEFLSSYGSADSGRHREWSKHNIQLNFHQENKTLHLTQEYQLFFFDPDAWEYFFFLQLFIPLYVPYIVLLYLRKKHTGHIMISHKLDKQTIGYLLSHNRIGNTTQLYIHITKLWNYKLPPSFFFYFVLGFVFNWDTTEECFQKQHWKKLRSSYYKGSLSSGRIKYVIALLTRVYP